MNISSIFGIKSIFSWSPNMKNWISRYPCESADNKVPWEIWRSKPGFGCVQRWSRLDTRFTCKILRERRECASSKVGGIWSAMPSQSHRNERISNVHLEGNVQCYWASKTKITSIGNRSKAGLTATRSEHLDPP
jgi:hypothetical protein